VRNSAGREEVAKMNPRKRKEEKKEGNLNQRGGKGGKKWKIITWSGECLEKTARYEGHERIGGNSMRKG